MASEHTKIPRAVSEFKLFLDYNNDEYHDAYTNIRPHQGWVIPYYSSALFRIVEDLQGVLYDNIYPKLEKSNPATDEEIMISFKGALKTFNGSTPVFDKIITKKKEDGEEPFLSTVEGIVCELLYKAIYKLNDVIQLAEEDTLRNKQNVSSIEKPYLICIITATIQEYKILKDKIQARPISTLNNDTNAYEEGFIIGKEGEKLKVIIARTHHQGIPAATNTTTKLILGYSPNLIVMLGHLAGNKNLKDNLNIGDIIVGRTAIDYENAIVIERKPVDNSPVIELKAKPNPIPADATLLQLLENFSLSEEEMEKIKNSCQENHKFSKQLNAHVGKIISGDALVRSESWFSKVISDNHGSLALDMETYGVYYASEHTIFKPKPLFISIKSVSDYGGSNTDLAPEIKDHYVRSQYAIETSINFFLKFSESNLPL